MNERFKAYMPLFNGAIGLPVALYLLSLILGETLSIRSLLLLSLLMVIYHFALRGMAAKFIDQPIAEKSTATLIEQHVVSGLLFSAFMTMMFELVSFSPPKTDLQIMLYFLFMAACFGVGTFVFSWFERRKTLRDNAKNES